MKQQKLIAACALTAVLLKVHATPLTVPGTSNPWLAGMTNGSTAGCGYDTAPAESPVLVSGATISSGWA